MPKQEAPKPGTYRAIVLESISKGWLTPNIVERTILTDVQVSRALRGIHESGYDTRTLQEREEARRAAIRLSRNSIFPDIGIYIGMGMAAIEIHEAESITGKAPHNIRNIRWTARHARERGYKGIKKFTEEEVANVRGNTSYQRRSSIRERAGLWLDAAAWVITSNLRVPKTRMEWMDLIDRYRSIGRISPEAHRWQAFVRNSRKRGLPSDWSGIIEHKRQMNESRRTKVRAVWSTNVEYRQIHERATIDPAVYPWALRRFSTWEMTLITGFTPDQVDNAITKRKLQGDLARATREETRRARAKARLGKKGNEEKIATPEELAMARLMRDFQEAGMVTQDLSLWEQLHALYGEHGRSMPEEPAERTALEMYLKALKAHIAADDQFVQTWRSIEKDADPDIFKPLAQEKLFVRVKLLSPWADGEDSNGLYTVTGESRRYRPIMEGREIVNDTSNLAIQRARIKNSQNGEK